MDKLKRGSEWWHDALFKDSKADTQLELLQGIIVICRNLLDRVDRDYTELRQIVADLDDSTPSRAAFEELHNRVDNIETRMSR